MKVGFCILVALSLLIVNLPATLPVDPLAAESISNLKKNSSIQKTFYTNSFFKLYNQL